MDYEFFGMNFFSTPVPGINNDQSLNLTDSGTAVKIAALSEHKISLSLI